MATGSDPRTNRLLAALPADDWGRWLPVHIPLGEVLHEPGVAMGNVYFPTTSIVSLLYAMEGGASAVHGLRDHAQPRHRAERRAGVSHAGAVPQGRVQPLYAGVAPVAALRAGADHADVADGRVQPASFARLAAVSLAAAQPRPAAGA